MRKYYYIFLLLALLFVQGCSCKEPQKSQQDPGTTDVTDPDKPERKTLLGLFDELIEKQKSGPRDHVFIVAHRANTLASVEQYIPENSIPNILKAIEKGADMVELDVRPTSDLQLVLMHDATVDATTTGTGNVSGLTLAQIKSFDMERGGRVYKDATGATVKVPTLEEALEACKDKIYVNLDIAGKNVPAGRLVRIIQEAGMQGQVMLYIGGDHATAMEYQYKDVTIAVHPYISKASDVTSYSDLPGAKLFQYNYSLYMSSGSTIGGDIRAAGGLSYSNILNNDSNLRSGDYSALDRFIESKTDFIQTDYSELVDRYLKTKNLR